MKTLLILPVALMSIAAQAALPPGAESLRRIAAVAQSPEVFQKIGLMGWVNSITENPNHSYIVATEKCRLLVTVDAVPMDHPGVNPLKVNPGVLTCRR